MRSDCRCCQGWYLARFDLGSSTPFCDDKQYGRLNVRARGSPATVGGSHTLRFPDPLFPEHVTPDQLLSHGSLPVVWSCQPVLVLHVLPLVAMYRSTRTARCAAAVGATTPTRTPHSSAGGTPRTGTPRSWASKRVNSASVVMQLARSWIARRGEGRDCKRHLQTDRRTERQRTAQR